MHSIFLHMLPEVKEDILDVLRRVAAIVQQKEDKDVLEMKELSNHVIHDATLFEDQDAVSIAVFVHALSKIIERMGADGSYKEFYTLIGKAAKELDVNDVQGFRGIMKKLFSLIEQKDSKLNLYATDVLHHSQIKKGCTVCEHGVSCAKSAELLNISQWDLMQYLGKTTTADHWGEGHDIRSRMRFVRGLFP
jgi:hypothetical protein